VEGTETFEFTAPLWRYPGAGGWHFVSLPPGIADEIADMTAGSRAGFGSVRVAVTVGTTSWRTSLFPDGKTGTYPAIADEHNPFRQPVANPIPGTRELS
jgi:hypothetical protein